MNENRSGESATLLPDGTLFVAGGATGSVTLQTAEILDPVTRAFTTLPKLNSARNQHTATLLPDGKVLLAGGSRDSTYLNTAELFDPSNNSFTLVGAMSQARKSHTATLLQDNDRVLVAGGKTASADSSHAEIYDVALKEFRQVADMNVSRSLFTSTLLPNGSVLVAAGRHGSSPTPEAELFDPVSETFSLTGSMNLQRKRHQASLLADGTVFVSGGASDSNGDQPNSGTPTCEIYDPASGTFTFTPQEMSVGRTEHDATLLADGRVIVTGGILTENQTERYDPDSQSFSISGSLLQARLRHVGILLKHPAWGSLLNKVLVIGGADIGNSAFGGLEQALSSVELYDPVTGQLSLFGNMTEARQNHTATLLQDGRIMIAGGVSEPAFSGTGEVINPDAMLTLPALLNISTRLNVGNGDNVLIGGFIVGGDTPQKVIVRGLGPSLPLPGILADPVLELHDDAGFLLASNNDWQESDAQAILDTGLAPPADSESAIVRTLDPGAYTAILSGAGGTTGIALVEIYYLDSVESSGLANISTRGLVQSNDNVMIGGIIVGGFPVLDIIVRAIGPSLPLAGALPDPILELHSGDGSLIATNDDWRTDNEAAITASGLAPTNDAESALLVTLPAGIYTAILRGANGTTGSALIEVYQLQP